MQVLRFLAVLLGAMAMMQSPAMAQQLPSGWTEQVDGDRGMRYTAPDQSEFVTIASFDTGGQRVDKRKFVAELAAAISSSECGTNDIEYVSSRNGQVEQGWLKAAGRTCGIAFGQMTGDTKITMVLCACKWPGSQGYAVYSRVLDDNFGPEDGAQPTGRPAEQRQPPVTSAVAGAPTGPINTSVESSGTTGVWVAITLRMVYDPVMTVRQEFGPSYLVLTPGGYFMESIDGPLDDAGAMAHAREYPEEGGRFTASGTSLILNYGSGERKVAQISSAGASRSYELDGDTYIAKRIFPDGARLSGLYSNSSITQAAAGIFVTGEHDFLFLPDGHFARGGQVSTMTGAFSSIGGRDQRTGRYQVRSSTLYLAYDDGEREALSLWQETEGGPVWFNGRMYEVREK